MSECARCGEDVRYGKARGGKWFVIDIQPSNSGTLVEESFGEMGIPVVREVDLFSTTGAKRYTDHETTCSRRRMK